MGAVRNSNRTFTACATCPAAGYDPQGAVDLQQTFVRLSEGRRSDWLTGLFSSHPPSQERVDANRRTAATLPAGGITG